MIPDKLFKAITHECKGYNTFLNGGNLEPGYRPDYVLVKENQYIILESENSSSRKTFVGGMTKAAHFLQGSKKGILIFVIVPKVNTSANAIAKHLKPYLTWLGDKTNLRDVYVIEAGHYYDGENVLAILKENFMEAAFKV